MGFAFRMLPPSEPLESAVPHYAAFQVCRMGEEGQAMRHQ
jgi:hypothetical protein